jgi:hypothetical protein
MTGCRAVDKKPRRNSNVADADERPPNLAAFVLSQDKKPRGIFP